MAATGKLFGRIDSQSAEKLPTGRLSTASLSSDRTSTGRLSTATLSNGRFSTTTLSTGRLSTDRLSNGRLSSDTLSTGSKKENRLSTFSVNLDKGPKKFIQSKLTSWFGSDDKPIMKISTEPTLLPEIDIGHIDMDMFLPPKSVISLPQIQPHEPDILVSMQLSNSSHFKFTDFEKDEREKIKLLNQTDCEDEADISGLEHFSSMLDMINKV